MLDERHSFLGLIYRYHLIYITAVLTIPSALVAIKFLGVSYTNFVSELQQRRHRKYIQAAKMHLQNVFQASSIFAIYIFLEICHLCAYLAHIRPVKKYVLGPIGILMKTRPVAFVQEKISSCFFKGSVIFTSNSIVNASKPIFGWIREVKESLLICMFEVIFIALLLPVDILPDIWRFLTGRKSNVRGKLIYFCKLIQAFILFICRFICLLYRPLITYNLLMIIYNLLIKVAAEAINLWDRKVENCDEDSVSAPEEKTESLKTSLL